MVDMLSTLLLLKMVISGFFLVWLRLEITMHRSLVRTVHAADYVAQLMTWIELSVLLGYAIPLLLPLLALAVYASKFELEALAVQPGVVIEGTDAPVQVGPVAYVLCGGLLMNGMMAFVFAESRLRGGTMVLLVACVCSCAMVGVYLAKRCGYAYACGATGREGTAARRDSYVQMLHQGEELEVNGEGEVDDGFEYHAM